MSVSYSEARDAIQGRFWAAWQAQAPAANGGTLPPVRWQGEDDGGAPEGTQPWARVQLVHGPAFQATLGRVGERSFERTGVAIVSVFAPLSRGQGLTQAEALAIIARDAFEGQTAGPGGCIWFRNVSISEVGPDGAWFQVNVTADFLYDELK